MDEITKIAKAWASQRWKEVVVDWLEQPMQDRTYRNLLVRPCIARLLKDIIPINSLVEIGCGDGAETLFVKECLENMGSRGTNILGIDLLEINICIAKKYAAKLSNISFEVGDITDKNSIYFLDGLKSKHDLVMSFFVLQDVPDIDCLLHVVRRMLRPGGVFISVIVHPDFAQALKDGGILLKTNVSELDKEHIGENGNIQWRYTSHYPIVRQNESPFYVPYFHRSINDYLNLFTNKHFISKQIIELMPSDDQKGNIFQESPFVEEVGNVYWPIINQIPSSVVFVCELTEEP